MSLILTYLSYHSYKDYVDWYWFRNLALNLYKLEQKNIYLNISEINQHIRERYFYEKKENYHCYFDNDKYNFNRYIYNISEYDADTESDDFITKDIENLVNNMKNINI
jgi:hypothetical protein